MGVFLGCCHVVIKFWKTFNSLTEVDVDNALTYQGKRRVLQLGSEKLL